MISHHTRCAREVNSSIVYKIITDILQESIKVTGNGCGLIVVGVTVLMDKFEDEPHHSFLMKIPFPHRNDGESIKNTQDEASNGKAYALCPLKRDTIP